MKKIFACITILLASLCLTGCGGSKYIQEIDLKTLNEKVENKESFVLEVMRTSCSACQDFAPKLEEVTSKYEVTVYQINTEHLSEEDFNTFKDAYSVSSTPTVVFFTEGQELTVGTRIVGSVSKDKLISQLKFMGYIQE